MDFEDQVRDAMHRSVHGVDPPVRELALRVVEQARSPQPYRVAVWATAAAAVTVAVTVGVTRPWAGPAETSPATPQTAARPCASDPRAEVLPPWAWGGFSDPEPVVPHVLGDEGRIVAILFGGRLHSPPDAEVSNKILWVSRTGAGGALEIRAVRAGDDRVVRREVAGAPGPSIIDLPAAGCWQLSLSWGPRPDQRDTMDLEYVDPRTVSRGAAP